MSDEKRESAVGWSITDFRGPAYAAICAEKGWDLETFAQLSERIEGDMQREGTCVVEGFCPRCVVRLTEDKHGFRCPVCDCYPHVKFDGDKCVSVGATSGWFRRGEK